MTNQIRLKEIIFKKTYKDGGLRMVDVATFIDSLKLSTLRLYCRNPTMKNPCNIPFSDILRFGANVGTVVNIEIFFGGMY